MADLLLHYAFGVFVASRFRYTRQARYWIGLAAIAPDLEGIVSRFVLWGGADWFGWSPAETAEVLAVFGHGGVLHSVLVTVIVALLAALFSLDVRLGGAVGVAWLSHAVLDIFTPGGILWFWPFSSAEIENALFVDWEPVLVVLSLFYLVGTVMGDLYLLDVRKEIGEKTRLILRKFGPRLAKGAAQMGGFVMVFLLVSKSVLLLGHGMAADQAIATGFPSFHIVEPKNGSTLLVTHWDAFGATHSETEVPYVPPGLDGATRTPALQALCYAAALDRVVAISHPVVQDASGAIVVVGAARVGAEDVYGQGQALVFTPDPSRDGFRTVWTADADTPQEVDLLIPVRLLDAYTC